MKGQPDPYTAPDRDTYDSKRSYLCAEQTRRRAPSKEVVRLAEHESYVAETEAAVSLGRTTTRALVGPMTAGPVCSTCDCDITATDRCRTNHAYEWGLEPELQHTRITEHCGDCGAAIGRPHHVPGCMAARCRHCGDQATLCPHMR